MITYPLTKYYYIIERVYFICRLFILFVSTFSFLLLFYAVSWRYKRDYLHSSMDISFYIMFYIINTMKLNIRQFNTTFLLTIQKKSRFELASLHPLFVTTPVITPYSATYHLEVGAPVSLNLGTTASFGGKKLSENLTF